MVLFEKLLPALLGGRLALLLAEVGLGDSEKSPPELRFVGLKPEPPDEAAFLKVEPPN